MPQSACTIAAITSTAKKRWKQVYAESGESDRPLVHALIMLSCAMHLHFKRGGGRGVVNLFERSLLTSR